VGLGSALSSPCSWVWWCAPTVQRFFRISTPDGFSWHFYILRLSTEMTQSPPWCFKNVPQTIWYALNAVEYGARRRWAGRTCQSSWPCTWASCLVSRSCRWRWTTARPRRGCEGRGPSSDSAASRRGTGSRSRAPGRAVSAAPTDSTAACPGSYARHLGDCRSVCRRRTAGNMCCGSSSSYITSSINQSVSQSTNQFIRS